MRYKITVNINTQDEMPSWLINNIAQDMLVQVESLYDGSYGRSIPEETSSATVEIEDNLREHQKLSRNHTVKTEY